MRMTPRDTGAATRRTHAATATSQLPLHPSFPPTHAVLSQIAAAGYACYAYDAHGHGRSKQPDPRRHNFIADFRHVVHDLILFVETVVK